MKALVLSGGSVRGVAYIGMLKALNEAGYEFDMYGGTSAGAIMASLLAAGYTPQQLRTYVMHASDEKLSMALSGFNLDNHDDVMRTLRQFALKELGKG